MLRKIEISEPMTLTNFVNLYNLQEEGYICFQLIKTKTEPEPVTNPITDEPVLDEHGNLIYPVLLNSDHIEFKLWTTPGALGRTIPELLSEYGNKTVVASGYLEDEEWGKILTITTK